VMPDASTERSAVGRPKDDAALVAVTQAER